MAKPIVRREWLEKRALLIEQCRRHGSPKSAGRRAGGLWQSRWKKTTDPAFFGCPEPAGPCPVSFRGTSPAPKLGASHDVVRKVDSGRPGGASWRRGGLSRGSGGPCGREVRRELERGGDHRTGHL